MSKQNDWSWKPKDAAAAYIKKHTKVKKPKRGKWKDKETKDFYTSWQWLKVRYEVLKAYGAVCMLCADTGHIVVDHIKPRSRYPGLELDFDNLQVLCNRCNRGKSADDETDFRPKLPEPELHGDEAEHMRSILN